MAISIHISVISITLLVTIYRAAEFLFPSAFLFKPSHQSHADEPVHCAALESV